MKTLFILFMLALHVSLFAAPPIIQNTMQLADVQKIGGSSTSNHALDGDILLTKESDVVFVRQYNPNTAQFEKIGQLSPSQADAKFAKSFAIEGDTIAVGGDNVVYIYSKPTNGWGYANESAKFVSTESTNNADFGVSIDISGDTIAVGVSGDIHNEQSNVYTFGYAYIVKKPLGGWNGIVNQSAKLIPERLIKENAFGESVAISNDTVIVGDPTYAQAYIFEKPLSGWSTTSDIYESQVLWEYLGGDSTRYGVSVDIDGDMLVVGAPKYFDDVNTNFYSGAFVYTKSDGSWSLSSKLAHLDAIESDQTSAFGGSVAISGTSIVVGSASDNNKGAFYLYNYSNSVWNGKKFISFNQEYSESFGSTVTISDSRVIAENNYGIGAVHVFENAIVQSVKENQTNALHLSAKSSEELHYIIRGGEDALKFNINEQSGLLTFKNVPDFENPIDANRDGIYRLKVYIGEYEFIVSHLFLSVIDSDAEDINIDPSSLKKLQDIKAVDEDNTYFGEGVAIRGNIAVIGAYGNSTHGPNSGLAYVYEYNATTKHFEKISTLGDADAEFGGELAKDIAIGDDYIVLGSSHAEVSQQTNAGAVYVYKKPLNGWASEPDYNEAYCKIVAADPQENQFFGNSVAVSGDTIAIAAVGDSNAKGAVYMVNKPSSGWDVDIKANIKLQLNVRDGDMFGADIALDGDTLVVGVPEANGGERESGKAFLFEKPLSGWKSTNEAISLTASDAHVDDKFGTSVAINGDLVVVGAPAKAANTGAAYSFKKPLSGWKSTDETAIITPPNLIEETYFANALSMSGTNVLIGVADHDYNRKFNLGSAYLMKLNANSAQVEKMIQLINPNVKDSNTNFGMTVGLYGDSAIIGAPNDGKGEVYLYKERSGISPVLLMYLLN